MIRGYMLFVRLNRFDGLRSPFRLLGFGRRRLHNFRRKDFSLIADTGKPAELTARDYLYATARISADSIYLLASPAIFGYIFNPVSFFFCYQKETHVATIVEVNNTFGQQKHFVLPAAIGPMTEKKDFYVSPFISPFGDFKMRVDAPADKLSIGIHTVGELKAELSGNRRALSDRGLLFMFLKYPLHTLRVIALIHWYALKLFFRGVPHYAKASADAAIIHNELRRDS